MNAFRMAITSLTAALLALVSAPAEAQTGSARAAGDWIGTVDAGAAKLQLAVHIQEKAGALSGTLDSVDQGASGLALANVTLADGTLAFEVPSVGGRYSGKWDAAGGAFAGEWGQGASRLPLRLVRGTPAARPVVAGLDGDWEGVLQAGEKPLRLVLHVATGAAGTTGSLASPDQGPGAVPLSSISRTAQKVSISAAAIQGSFDATLSPDGQTLNGTWTQGGQAMPLLLKLRAAGTAN